MKTHRTHKIPADHSFREVYDQCCRESATTYRIAQIIHFWLYGKHGVWLNDKSLKNFVKACLRKGLVAIPLEGESAKEFVKRCGIQRNFMDEGVEHISLQSIVEEKESELFESAPERVRERHKTPRSWDLSYPETLSMQGVDAACMDVGEACKGTKRKLDKGYPPEQTKYPVPRGRCRVFRTAMWENASIKLVDSRIRLSMGKKHEGYLWIDLPPRSLSVAKKSKIVTVKLYFDRPSSQYIWHITFAEEMTEEAEATVDSTKERAEIGDPSGVVSLDPGEIHPFVISGEDYGVLVSCRELRAVKWQRNKRLASLQKAMSKCKKGSIKWRRLLARKRKLLAYWKNKIEDINHKITTATVNACVQMGAHTIAIGNVKGIADGKRLRRKEQQKISQWNHLKHKEQITYKAERHGIKVVETPERYTSQTCPSCGHRKKPKGRVYKCSNCGFEGHRDLVGATNIRSVHIHGEPGVILPPTELKVIHPFDCRSKADEKNLSEKYPVESGTFALGGEPKADGLKVPETFKVKSVIIPSRDSGTQAPKQGDLFGKVFGFDDNHEKSNTSKQERSP